MYLYSTQKTARAAPKVKATVEKPGNCHLVDVGDEFALSWHVHFLVIGPHLALDSEQKHLQVALLSESVEKEV